MESNANMFIPGECLQAYTGHGPYAFRTCCPLVAMTSHLTVSRKDKAAGITIIAVGFHKRKMSIPAGVIREALTAEEGNESTHRSCLSDR